MTTKKSIPYRRCPRKCALIGFRFSQFPAEMDEEALRDALDYAIRQSIFRGCDTYISDMKMGVPLLAAEIVLALKREYPHIRLHGYVPCETQASGWSEHWRERYFTALERADETVLLSHKYKPGCLHVCTRTLLNHADFVIAAYDTMKTMQDAYAMRYAIGRGLEHNVILMAEESMPRLERRALS